MDTEQQNVTKKQKEPKPKKTSTSKDKDTKKEKGKGSSEKMHGDGNNMGVEELKTQLDNVSKGSSAESLEGATQAIEEALPAGEEGTQFFDADTGSRPAAELSPHEREELEQELKKTEDEIGTLRQVLEARVKHASELKHKLGYSPWTQVTHDVSEGFQKVKDTNAYQKTHEMIHTTAGTVNKKLGEVKASSAFKSFEQAVGSAYSSVKAKVSASTSMNQLYGGGGKPTQEGGSSTQPTTPSGETSPFS